MRILFSTPILHHPPIGGPALRIETSIKALSRIADLFVYSRVNIDEMGGNDAVSFYQNYCNELLFAPSTTACRPLRLLARYTNGLMRRVFHRQLNDISGHDDLIATARRLKVDVIWLGYGNISYPLLKRIKSKSSFRVVLDTDSVWSRFVLRGLPFATTEQERRTRKQEGENKEKEERWGTKLADVTTAVSEVDASYYRNLAIDPSQIHIFRNAVDVDDYARPSSPPDGFGRPAVFLAGTFGKASPMEDSARWFINEVLPLVRQRVPEVRVYIVGKQADTVLSDVTDRGVFVKGEVTSVLPYLFYADVAIVPLRFESGTRFKILEAGACGTPVVSTTLGAEGLDVCHEKDILIADQPEPFAASVIRLIENREAAFCISSSLKDTVHEKYSLGALGKDGQTILNHILRSF